MRRNMLQDPLFTWVFYVLPVSIGIVTKYLILKGKSEDEYPKWSNFIFYYMVISVSFWIFVSFSRANGII